jgi:hypothetical protein
MYKSMATAVVTWHGSNINSQFGTEIIAIARSNSLRQSPTYVGDPSPCKTSHVCLQRFISCDDQV